MSPFNPGDIFNNNGEILNKPLSGGIDPSLDPGGLKNINPFPKINRTLKQQTDALARRTAESVGLPKILGKKLNVPGRRQVVHYPTVLAHLVVFLDDVPGTPAGKKYDLVRPILTMTLDNNGHKEADCLELDLDYNDFPFDPRLVKNIVVSMWVDYVDGLLPPTTSKQAEAKVFSKNAKQIFEGYADEYRVCFSDNDGLVAKIKCRDYTGLLIDMKIIEGDYGTIRGTEKMTTIVKKLCGRYNLKVIFSEGLEASCPTVSQYFDDADHRLVEESSSYWDVILKMAEMLGCITFVFGQHVYFGRPDPQAIYEAVHGPRSAETLLYVWGENMEELELCRKYTDNNHYTCVEIIGYDEKRKKRFSVFWPEPLDRHTVQVQGRVESWITQGEPSSDPGRVAARQSKAQAKAAPKIAHVTSDGKGGFTVSGKENESVSRQVYRLLAPLGVNDVKHLKEIAKGVYQNMARSEIEGRMKAHGHTDLMAGMAFQIVLSTEQLKLLGSYPDTYNRIHALIERGYSKTLAITLARAFEEWDNQWWYILSARHHYSDDTGYEVDVDFISFANFDVVKKAKAKESAPPTTRGGKSQSKASAPIEQTQRPIQKNSSGTSTPNISSPVSSVIKKLAPKTPKTTSLPLSGSRTIGNNPTGNT